MCNLFQPKTLKKIENLTILLQNLRNLKKTRKFGKTSNSWYSSDGFVRETPYALTGSSTNFPQENSHKFWSNPSTKKHKISSEKTQNINTRFREMEQTCMK